MIILVVSRNSTVTLSQPINAICHVSTQCQPCLFYSSAPVPVPCHSPSTHIGLDQPFPPEIAFHIVIFQCISYRTWILVLNSCQPACFLWSLFFTAYLDQTLGSVYTDIQWAILAAATASGACNRSADFCFNNYKISTTWAVDCMSHRMKHRERGNTWCTLIGA